MLVNGGEEGELLERRPETPNQWRLHRKKPTLNKEGKKITEFRRKLLKFSKIICQQNKKMSLVKTSKNK